MQGQKSHTRISTVHLHLDHRNSNDCHYLPFCSLDSKSPCFSLRYYDTSQEDPISRFYKNPKGILSLADNATGSDGTGEEIGGRLTVGCEDELFCFDLWKECG